MARIAMLISRVTIPENGVMQPTWNSAAIIHQVTNDSRTDLKLFSFGFRRIITFSAPYTTSEFLQI